MTNLARQLGIYSSQKRNRLKKILKKVIFVSLISLLILIGRQGYFRFKSKQERVIAPEEDILAIISSTAKQYSLPLEKIDEKPDMIILLLEDQTQVLLDKKKALDNQLAALQLIINQDKISGRKAKKIDLRFNNPIVVYQ